MKISTLCLSLSLSVFLDTTAAFQQHATKTQRHAHATRTLTVLEGSSSNDAVSSSGFFGFLKSKPVSEETDIEVIERMYEESNDSPPATLSRENDDMDAAKFGIWARIESIKCVVVGALAGGIALAPASLIRDIFINGGTISQWELDTDMGALNAALFAIVYRYCIREDTNQQLKDGVVGAFFVTRTLSRLQAPSYCTPVPLSCGAPLDYFDWNLLGQIAISGAESWIVFFAAASAMEYCFEKGYISKFPG